MAEWQGLASEETGIAVAKLATLVEESPKELGPLIVQTEVCCAYDCYRRLSQYGQVERPDVTVTITPVQMCNVD